MNILIHLFHKQMIALLTDVQIDEIHHFLRHIRILKQRKRLRQIALEHKCIRQMMLDCLHIRTDPRQMTGNRLDCIIDLRNQLIRQIAQFQRNRLPFPYEAQAPSALTSTSVICICCPGFAPTCNVNDPFWPKIFFVLNSSFVAVSSTAPSK